MKFSTILFTTLTLIVLATSSYLIGMSISCQNCSHEVVTCMTFLSILVLSILKIKLFTKQIL